MKRVIVIGLDGLEPRIVEPLVAAGALPNLQRLSAMGALQPRRHHDPAQTPVAWSTFATGVNPGGHGIFDFLRRDPITYLPDIALNRYAQKNVFLPPTVLNCRRGKAVWETLSGAGIGSTILRCPCTFPPDPIRGRMLSGMGVPDLRGGFGTPTYYTSAPDETPREGENLVRVENRDGIIATHLVGPRNARGRDDVRLGLTIHLDPDLRRVLVRPAGSTQELEVREGAWSDWLRVNFKVALFNSVQGLVRFRLRSVGPRFEMYASPVNFDPSAPLFPISAPDDYAWELAEAIGPFHTTGMVEDHTGLLNERLDEEAFLDQCETAWQEREAMMRHELEQFDSGLFYCLFDTPDRVQHMFWRFREPDHPSNRGRPTRPELAGVVEDQYRRCDRIVGEALSYADDETLVIALSDHGFNSFQRGFHINSWLRENGLLALRPGLEPGEEAGDLLRGVDWSRTKAYAMGLSGIFLNLEGREGQGIVKPADAEALKDDIGRGLTGLHDPDRGALAVRRVLPREAVYRGSFVDEAPDLLVQFAEGYRVSWESSMGNVAAGTFADNVKKWGGDHIIDPLLVPGVLFMNRPFRTLGPDLKDLAPTILAALGVSTPPEMEGSSLLS